MRGVDIVGNMEIDMMPEIMPEVSWTDDQIVDWARSMGLDKYPIAKVELGCAVSINEPDIAVVDFQTQPATVRRMIMRWDLSNGYSQPITLIKSTDAL